MRQWDRFVGGLALASAFAMGCSDSGSGNTTETDGPGVDAQESEAPTWYQDVAPVVGEKCTQCHEEGGIAPFDLTSYDSAQPWASLMAEETAAGSMPPFLAHDTDECQPRLGWLDDLRLSDDEKKLLADWAEAGAPEGDLDSAAEVTRPTPIDLESEDIVLKIPEPITVDGSEDIHTCMLVDPNIDSDTYVTSRLIHSGNNAVLHHVVSYVVSLPAHEDGTPATKAELEQAMQDAKGIGIGGRYDCFGGPGLSDTDVQTQMLDAWAPGGVPNDAPPNSGQPLSKESLVILDVHYHPTGAGPEVDEDTYLALQTTNEDPQYISRVILLGNFEDAERDYGAGLAKLVQQEDEEAPEFLIPAGAKEHVESMTWEWTLGEGVELKVYGAGTHMHYVGYDMLVELENGEPAGSEDARECLIQTPVWDFNWQRGYGYDGSYEELSGMQTGDVLHLRCMYDNSLDNPYVVEALADRGLEEPVDVPLGEDTLDEMCLVGLGIMYPNVPAAN